MSELVHYLPTAPTAHPASLLVAGDAAFLQLSAQWDPPAAALEALRGELAAGGPPPALAPPLGLIVPTAELVLDGEVLQRAGTSRVPPWTAVFALALTPAQRDLAAAALAGRTGTGHVRFLAVLDGAPHPLDLDLAAFGTEPTPVATTAIAGLARADRSQPC